MHSLFDACLMGQGGTSTPSALNWTAVVGSANESPSTPTLVAVNAGRESDDTPNAIYAYSTNGGATWSKGNFGVGAIGSYDAVAYDQGTKQFVGLADSSDAPPYRGIATVSGTPWVQGSMLSASSWRALASDSSTGKLFGLYLTSAEYSADGGANWSTTGLTASSHSWHCACSNNAGRWFVSGDSNNTTHKVGYSDNDGASWTFVSTGLANKTNITGIAYNGTTLCIVGYDYTTGSNVGVCATSTDNGASWTVRTIQNQVWHCIGVSGTTFVAGGEAGAISTSPTGVTWTARSSTTSGTIWSGCASVTITATVYTVLVGQQTGAAAFSTNNGASWTASTMPTE